MKNRHSKSDIETSKRLFECLADGGVWGVPGSGLVFRREGEVLVLRAVMPFSEVAEAPVRSGIPETEEQLLKWQQADFDAIVIRFKAAGIRVVKDIIDEQREVNP